MKRKNTFYTSKKTEMRKSPIQGRGLFTKDRISKGELVVDLKEGEIITADEEEKRYSRGIDYCLQVADNLFLNASLGEPEQEVHINHSCNPNCGIKNSEQIVAMRDIELGEEVTFDYAMSRKFRIYDEMCLREFFVQEGYNG